MNFTKRLLAAFLAATPFLLAVPAACAEEKIKVACVGDSITQGLGNTPYPTRLQALLGDKYDVQNFGLWGTTGCNNTGRPYTTCDDSCYQNSLSYQPDIVVLMLGTNDGNEGSIAYSEEHYKEDMTALIESYRSLESKPKVVLVTSPHAYIEGNAPVNSRIAPMQRELADELDLPLVDMNALTENMPENFQDGLHPSEAGYFLVALRLYEQVFQGSVADVTVKTEPKAKVMLNAYTCETDENGTVTFPMATGEQLLQVQKKGFEPVYTAVNLAGKSEIECTLRQTANIALSGTVFTSSDENAAAIADGDLSTAWQSEAQTAEAYFGFVLPSGRTVSSVTVLWEKATRPAADETGYTVEISADGSTWQAAENPVYAFGSGEETVLDTVTFSAAAVKGVRVVLHAFSSDKYAPKVYELSAYGEQNGRAEVNVTLLLSPEEIAPETEKHGLPAFVLPVAVGVVLALAAAGLFFVFRKK